MRKLIRFYEAIGSRDIPNKSIKKNEEFKFTKTTKIDFSQ